MPSATNQHQHKRRFQQPDITSYFSRSTSSSTRGSTPIILPDRSSPLPAAPIQSSLLNVGMRVRKSVPDGYRTTKASRKMLSKSVAPPVTVGAAQTSSRNAPTSRAELTPFCGILKTGGYDSPSQMSPQFGSSSASLDSDMEDVIQELPQLVFDGEGIDGYDGPDFTSSQESNDTVSTVPDGAPVAGMTEPNLDTLFGNRKRPFFFQENDFADSGDLYSAAQGDSYLEDGLSARGSVPELAPTAIVGRNDDNDAFDFGEADFLSMGEWEDENENEVLVST
ncbi:MAG: hypothetical protein M1819_006270 [Sarea resinae]|nr:MAG: hypothetical protein M1819_006270 [Sarea resinae]